MTDDSTQFFVKISNVSSTVTIKELKELLECFGYVKKIWMHEVNVKERFSIAQFEHLEQSLAATGLSGTKVGDLEIKVRQVDLSEVESIKRNYSTLSGITATQTDINNQGKMLADNWREHQINRTIYVGNINPYVTEDLLWAFFIKQGPIKFIKMSSGGILNAYCFIEFVDIISAQKAHNLNGSNFQGRPLRIGRVKSPVAIPGVQKDILNNPIKLKLAVKTAKLALEAFEKKKNPNLKSEDGILQNREKRKRRSRSTNRYKSKSKTRSDHHQRPKYKRSSRRHRSRTRSRSRDHHRSQKRSKTSQSSSRRRQRKSSRSHSRGRRKNSRSIRVVSCRNIIEKPEMVWDGFNWHPFDSAQGKATKEGEKLGAPGPKIGNSLGYMHGKGFVGI